MGANNLGKSLSLLGTIWKNVGLPTAMNMGQVFLLLKKEDIKTFRHQYDFLYISLYCCSNENL